MDQAARKIHIAKFRARKTMLLIVTDVAARGIDIPLLDNVINYDFPPKPKLFVHRYAGKNETLISDIIVVYGLLWCLSHLCKSILVAAESQHLNLDFFPPPL